MKNRKKPVSKLLVSSEAQIKWLDGEINVNAPSSSRTIVTHDTSVLLLLNEFANPKFVSEAIAAFPEIPAAEIEEVAKELIDQHILVELPARKERSTAEWEAASPLGSRGSTVLFVVPPNLSRYGEISIPTGLMILAPLARSCGFEIDFLVAATRKSARGLSSAHIVRPLSDDLPPIASLESFVDRVEERFVRHVGSRGPTVLAISCFTSALYTSTMMLATLIRARFPELPIIVGGYHPSIDPESMRSDVRFYAEDLGGLEKWEKVAPEFVGEIRRSNSVIQERGDFVFDGIFQGRALESFVRYLTRSSASAGRSPETEIFPLVASGAFPFSRFKYDTNVLTTLAGKKTANEGEERGEQLFPLCFSVGCPHRCSFCINSAQRERWEAIDAEQAVDIVEYLHLNNGITFFPIADANFGSNRKWCGDFFERLCAQPWAEAIRLSVEISVLNFTLRDWDVLKRLSVTFQIGVESCSPDMLRRMQKANNPSAYLKRLRALLDLLGPRADAIFLMLIIGFPGETKESLRQTFSTLLDDYHVLERPNVILSPQIFIPMPGTHASVHQEEFVREFGYCPGDSDWWMRDPADRYENLRPSSSLSIDMCSDVVECFNQHYRELRGGAVYRDAPPWSRLAKARLRQNLLRMLKDE